MHQHSRPGCHQVVGGRADRLVAFASELRPQVILCGRPALKFGEGTPDTQVFLRSPLAQEFPRVGHSPLICYLHHAVEVRMLVAATWMSLES